MGLQLGFRLALSFLVLFASIATVRASCNDDGFDPRGNSCGFQFTGGTAFGVAIIVGAIYLTIKRRRARMARAHLAAVQDAQAAQRLSNYTPNYGQSYRHSQPFYPPPPPPPPGPPPDDVKDPVSPPYQPPDVPAYPPPTYAPA
ncbi:hypothetical protein HWV62_28563 [Athelia sp. TMB]|nr:hypothetical protein HWV62_28563 [Athelia sp. TMB]